MILFSVGWPRLQSRVLHQSRDFLRSDVSLGSQCSCHLSLFIKYVCVWSTKSSNHAGLLCCSKLQQFTSNPKHNDARVPAESNELTLMLCLIMPICVVSTLLSAFFRLYWILHINAKFEANSISFCAKSTNADCRTPETKRTINW